MSFTDAFKWIGAMLAGIAGYLFGGANVWMTALLVFIAMDYITGVIAAVINKELSSAIGFRGILKKVLYLFVVIIAHVMDNTVGLNGTLETVVIAYMLANEGLSMLENIARSGVPFPEKLVNVLKQLRDKE